MILPTKQLVPARETCAALKAAGFPQDTAFELSPAGHVWPVGGFLEFHKGADAAQRAALVAAPTLAEILEVLRTMPALAHATIMVGADSDNHDGTADWIATNDPDMWNGELQAHSGNAAEALAQLYLQAVRA